MGSKVAIVGAGGLVGSCTAFALQSRGSVRDLALLDVNQQLVNGQRLDLLHSSPLLADQNIYVGDNADYRDSDVICITAGLRRKPDESRLDLINRNLQLFQTILAEINQAGLKKDAVVLVVSNPVDILTRVAAGELPLPATQVLGLGTQLDTIRFRSLLAAKLNRPASQVSALILGEHGDSMVPIWSSASIGGLALEKFPGWNNAIGNQIFEQTKKSGAEVIKGKGGAGFAVGVAIADVIESVVLNQERILPLSTVQSGQAYGIRNVALSVPTVVGKQGAIDHLEIELWPKELQGLKSSVSSLERTWNSINH